MMRNDEGRGWTRLVRGGAMAGLLVLLSGACGPGGDGSSLLGGDGGAEAEHAEVEGEGGSMTPGLRAAYGLAQQRDAGAAYAVAHDTEGLVADNPAQRFEVRLDTEGVHLVPGRSDWDLHLWVDGFGCAGAMEAVNSETPRADRDQANQVWQDHGPLAAWYLNGPLGLQQGFEVTERPACVDDALLRVRVAVEGLSPVHGPHGAVVLRDETGGGAMHVDGLYVTDARGTELEAALGVDGDAVTVDVDAAAAVFPLSIDPVWSQQDKLVASNAAANDYFGAAVSVSGDTAVVGATLEDGAATNAGAAYVFVRSGGVWTEQQKLIAADAAEGDGFGGAVSVSGDTVLVGASGDDDAGTTSGSAYVFVRNAGVWTQQQKLVAGDANAGDAFGFAVSVAGDTAVIGAYGDDNATGSAYVFARNGNNWTQQAKLTAIDAAADDRFGYAVSLSGDTVIVGAHANDDAGSNTGSAYVFVRNGTAWPQQTKLVAGDAAAGDYFGYAVDLSGNTAIVGARFDEDAGFQSGSAYVFLRSNGAWAQQQKLIAPDTATGDQFGFSVSVSGDTVLVGASGDDDAGTTSGSAHVFARSGSVWSHQEKIVAADAAAGDRFGDAVGVSGRTTVVGSIYDDDGGSNSGSATVFVIPNLGATCTLDAECDSGTCVDGVCCATTCGGGDPTDCQACTAALTGGDDGTCAPILAGTTCRDATGACDVTETCDGTATACPADALAPAATVCREAAGPCDVAESCTGSDAACPGDALVAGGTECRAAAGACDLAEACDGQSSACPDDALVATGTVCRDPLGACDYAEQCTGDSPACPEDILEPETTVCRPSAGACDAPETCNGTSVACPDDLLRDATAICRPSTGTCDPAEQCDGETAACPEDVVRPEGPGCEAEAPPINVSKCNCAVVGVDGDDRGWGWWSLLALGAAVSRRRRHRRA